MESLQTSPKRTSKVVCVGGANLDVKLKAKLALRLRDSHPVRSHRSHGGVARNITENLARLGVPVSLISRVGKDANGDELLEHLVKLSVDVSEISRSDVYPTSTYTVILEPDGEMFVAAADMEIHSELRPASFLGRFAQFEDADFLVIDTNVSTELLEHFSHRFRPQTQVWAVPVSAAKVKAVKSVLSKLDGLILNRGELEVLAEQSVSDLDSLKDVSSQIHSKGLSRLVVTLGAEGVFWADSEGYSYWRNYEPLVPVDVTGAGDGFVAGTIYGLLKRDSFANAVLYGAAASRLALKSPETVNPNLDERSLQEEWIRMKKEVWKV